jgi:hypothetical protein
MRFFAYIPDVRPVLFFRQQYGARFEHGFPGTLMFFAAAWQVGNTSSSLGVAGKQHFAIGVAGKQHFAMVGSAVVRGDAILYAFKAGPRSAGLESKPRRGEDRAAPLTILADPK